jgi:ectoine hydroxylase-related dioxygenase (phytanoyl-CoA dioxygenase family)
MTLTDSKDDQGGFVCVPQSHNYHQKYFQDKGISKHKSDWYKFPEEEKVK